MNDWHLRMKDLCTASGLSRQTIHFYIQEGILPPGHKTGRNTAVYSAEHIERLTQIRRLQHERFLPLKAIKALMSERAAVVEEYSAPQQAFLRALQPEFTSPAPKKPVPVEELIKRGVIKADDFDEMVAQGALTAINGPSGQLCVLAEDVELVKICGQLRAAGLSETEGFTMKDLSLYQDLVSQMAITETGWIVKRLGHRPPADVAALIKRSLPIANALIVHLRNKRVHDLLSTF